MEGVVVSLPARRVNQQVTSCELLRVSLKFTHSEYFATFSTLEVLPSQMYLWAIVPVSIATFGVKDGLLVWD